MGRACNDEAGEANNSIIAERGVEAAEREERRLGEQHGMWHGRGASGEGRHGQGVGGA